VLSTKNIQALLAAAPFFYLAGKERGLSILGATI